MEDLYKLRRQTFKQSQYYQTYLETLIDVVYGPNWKFVHFDLFIDKLCAKYMAEVKQPRVLDYMIEKLLDFEKKKNCICEQPSDRPMFKQTTRVLGKIFPSLEE